MVICAGGQKSHGPRVVDGDLEEPSFRPPKFSSHNRFPLAGTDLQDESANIPPGSQAVELLQNSVMILNNGCFQIPIDFRNIRHRSASAANPRNDRVYTRVQDEGSSGDSGGTFSTEKLIRQIAKEVRQV